MKNHLSVCNAFRFRKKAPQLTQGTISFEPTPRTTKEELNYLAATALLTSGRPPTTFEGPEWAAFLTALNPSYVQPSRYTMKALVPEVYDSFFRKVRKILDNCPLLNLVFDGSEDSANNRLINVSAQIPGSVAFYWTTIDTKNQLHTAENTVKILEPIFNDLLNSQPTRINSIVTDTNSTMRKTQRLLG
jgi:hypothetical protein